MLSFPSFLPYGHRKFEFKKLIELEATEKLNHNDRIAVTEVQAQNPDLLKMTGFQEFVKLHPVDHPLGKKEEE